MTKRESINTLFDVPFTVQFYKDFDYSVLNNVLPDKPRGKRRRRLNKLFCMLDTETSKTHADTYKLDKHGKKIYDDNVNYIVKWSIAINVWGWNIACLWGNTPWELVDTLQCIHNSMNGNATIFYCHNWSYDNIFTRKFLFARFGYPMNQLSTKPHYPVSTEFENGIIIRDSLILAQRSLERWGADMQVEHAKAVGKWDYGKIRNQSDIPNNDELLYICNDVLCGVECLNKFRRAIHKTYAGMPYTATGVIRDTARKRGYGARAHERARQCYTDYDTYDMLERVYHGGYTHANRHVLSWVINDNIVCYDFASSYPFCLLAYKYPCEAFMPDDATIDEIVQYHETDAYIFTFRASGVKLKDYNNPMPIIQTSKCKYIVNGISDNGRILQADFIQIDICDVDLLLYLDAYDFYEVNISNVKHSAKEYLPRWLSDYIYELFVNKTKLKGVDDVLYAIAKSWLNSVYG